MLEIIRTPALILIAILFWCLWSLPSLLNNNPQLFQAYGAIIICYGVYFYGRNRQLREKFLQDANSAAINSGINYLQAKTDFHESVAHNTANMHTLSYLKLLSSLGLQDSNVPDMAVAINSLENQSGDIEEHNKLYDELLAKEADFKLKVELIENSGKTEGRFAELFGRLEIWFIIIGTLQSSFGGYFANYFNEVVTPKIENILN